MPDPHPGYNSGYSSSYAPPGPPPSRWVPVLYFGTFKFQIHDCFHSYGAPPGAPPSGQVYPLPGASDSGSVNSFPTIVFIVSH